ncbi:MAG: methyltransferase [Betaproteobacteria bacterium RIFCSPLOWO2_02_FULL_65_24]|nr:MAG: methyltransferase [Betaproteobacteria bacterium RIFCSPLOWO2_02_FULL_65_24]
MNAKCLLSALAAAAALAGCAGMTPHAWEVTPEIRAVVASPDRSDADRKTDERRRPEMLLAFAGVKPGMQVLEVGAGAGYSAELLARSVGPQGIVYAHNSPDAIARFIKTRFDERAAKPVMHNVVKLIRDFDDPVPSEVRGLDLATMLYEYHDTPAMGIDRTKMNRRIFDALKPGGYFVVADHSAKAGAGVSGSKTLHRIEEVVVRQEVEAAGFKLVAAADFLRNPDDPREATSSRAAFRVDAFVLKFVKP